MNRRSAKQADGQSGDAFASPSQIDRRVATSDSVRMPQMPSKRKLHANRSRRGMGALEVIRKDPGLAGFLSVRAMLKAYAARPTFKRVFASGFLAGAAFTFGIGPIAYPATFISVITAGALIGGRIDRWRQPRPRDDTEQNE